MTFTLGAPQLIILGLCAFNIIYATIHNGEQRPPYSALYTCISAALDIAILYWGGFFS